jgi:hypothetical protein
MDATVKLLDYAGTIDHKKIDDLLDFLKKNSEYTALDKVTGRRVYAIIVECLENIAKHFSCEAKIEPSITVVRQDSKIIVRAGNPVSPTEILKLKRELDLINRISESALQALYDSKINQHYKRGQNGAGLGFMLMKLKSQNPIEYTFTDTEINPFFEIKVTLNQ